MRTIVCATRGGEGSRVAQEQAIRYAQQAESRLIFVYVADTNSAVEHDPTLNSALEAELTWIGRVLLGVAQQRAKRAHVDAEVAVRVGPVKETIVEFVQEVTADVLLLGASRGTTTAVFGDDAIENFATAIQEQSHVKVEIVRPEYV